MDVNHNAFNGDISQWDVSNVTNMNELFRNSAFNGDISKWNTSNVVTMHSMFVGSSFNRNISSWNVSKVIDMNRLFFQSLFDSDISQWDVSNVMNMSYMFYHSKFNRDLSQWNVSKVMNLRGIFNGSEFRGDISKWTVFAPEEACVFLFSQFHDSPLGYMGILRNEYEFPKEDERAAQFEHLRSLCEGLNMDVKSAARYIYQEIHQNNHMEIPPPSGLFELSSNPYSQ